MANEWPDDEDDEIDPWRGIKLGARISLALIGGTVGDLYRLPRFDWWDSYFQFWWSRSDNRQRAFSAGRHSVTVTCPANIPVKSGRIGVPLRKLLRNAK